MTPRESSNLLECQNLSDREILLLLVERVQALSLCLERAEKTAADVQEACQKERLVVEARLSEQVALLHTAFSTAKRCLFYLLLLTLGLGVAHIDDVRRFLFLAALGS
jgi:hypothetical protein